MQIFLKKLFNTIKYTKNIKFVYAITSLLADLISVKGPHLGSVKQPKVRQVTKDMFGYHPSDRFKSLTEMTKY